MQQQNQFILFDDYRELKTWLNSNQFTRTITRVQMHHTWAPAYKDFNGTNYFAMLESMKSYHIGPPDNFKDIAQNMTIFPDGKIAICRSFNEDPAGIKGANSGAICIENIGNFDKDVMTVKQRDSILYTVALLSIRFKFAVNTSTVLYHHWFDLDTGKRTDGTGNTKTCPGTGWFGGNSVASAQNNFYPLVQSKVAELTTTQVNPFNACVDVLHAINIIGSPDQWKDAVNANKPIPADWVKALITNTSNYIKGGK